MIAMGTHQNCHIVGIQYLSEDTISTPTKTSVQAMGTHQNWLCEAALLTSKDISYKDTVSAPTIAVRIISMGTHPNSFEAVLLNIQNYTHMIEDYNYPYDYTVSTPTKTSYIAMGTHQNCLSEAALLSSQRYSDMIE